MVASILSQMWVSFCCVSANMLVVSLAVFIRNVPAIGNGLRRSLRGLLVLSYRAYHALFSRLAPVVSRLAGVDLLHGFPRLAAAMIVSQLAGHGVLLLLGFSPSLAGAIVFGLHGLAVGALWDRVVEPGGVRLGERLE